MSDDDNITYREYQNEIESLADTVEDENQEREDVELGQLVFETIDGHQWIIYHGYPLQVLQHTDPEEWKHYVGDDSDHREVLQAMAYSAMRKDLWEELYDRGIEA
jgi:hypothetical protein